MDITIRSTREFPTHRITVPSPEPDQESQILCLTVDQLIDLYEKLSHQISQTHLFHKGVSP